MRDEVIHYETLYSGMDGKIAANQAAYEKALIGRYPEEITNNVRTLQERIAQYSVLGT